MPVSLTLPPGYYIERSRDGFALHSDQFGEIGDGDFGCWASACHAAQDHFEAQAEDAGSELVEAEFDRLYALVNAQGGVATDEASKARNYAVARVLAAIDGISMPAASEQKAA